MIQNLKAPLQWEREQTGSGAVRFLGLSGTTAFLSNMPFNLWFIDWSILDIYSLLSNFYSFWWCSYFRYPVLFLIEFLCILSLELFIHVFWGLESQKVENIRIHTYMVTLCSELALDFHTLNLVFLLDSSSFLYGHLLNIAKQSCFGFQSRNVFRFFLRSTHFFLGQFLL